FILQQPILHADSASLYIEVIRGVLIRGEGGATARRSWITTAAEREQDMPELVPPRAGNASDGGIGDSRISGGRRLASLSKRASALAVGTLWMPLAARAQDLVAVPAGMSTLDVIQLAVFAGVTGAAMLSAIWLIRERGRTAAENAQLRGRVADLGAALHRAETLLNLNDQRIIVWPEAGRKPELVGTLPATTGVPEERGQFLAFGRWLEHRSAAELEHAVAALREAGTTFEIIVETQNGTLLEAQGRRSGAARVLRFRSLSAAERGHARLQLEHQHVLTERDNLLGLANALAMPMWMRGADGRLQWVNHAYAAAVEA